MHYHGYVGFNAFGSAPSMKRMRLLLQYQIRFKMFYFCRRYSKIYLPLWPEKKLEI